MYYRIIAVDFDGRKTYSETKTLNVKPQTLNGFSLYPNPAKDFVTINCKDGIKQLLITDYLGKKVYQSSVNGQQSTINCKQFFKGLYIVQITTTKGNVLNEKLIIE